MNQPAFLQKFTPKCLLLFMATASAIMLAAALLGQYGFGWHPCELCLYQRYPYVGIILFGLSGAFILKDTPARLAFIALCIALFALDAGIAFYHTGVEMKWFPGPSSCSAGTSGTQTLEEMRAAIMKAPLVSCDQAMAYVLGLSLAAWNFLAASALTLFSSFMLYTFCRKPHA